MANEQNLIPNSARTPSELRERGIKGGIASGKARREKATMKAVLLEMLDEVPKENNPRGLSYRQMATLGLIKGAVKGNSQNYKTITETLGELFAQEENKSSGVIVELIEALNNAKK